LWDVCRVPDFRGISHAEHSSLLETIFCDLHELGRVPDDWLARQVKRIDRTDGDIDTLSKRLAYIRTWTYVAQRKGWVDDETHWRGETRAVEDRLSDALHERLTQRFVDRRTSVLLRRLKQKEAMVAEVNENGDVTVEGEFVGRLEGFRFIQDRTLAGQEEKAVRQASLQALSPQFHLRADRFYNAPDTEIDYTDQGGLMWGNQAVGKIVAGSDPLKPQVEAFVDEVAGGDVCQKVQRRLQHFIDRKVALLFEPLLNIQRDDTLAGMARGLGFRLVENFGIIPRSDVAEDVKSLDQEARGALRKHGVRFGQFTVFMPLLLKPAPTRLRLLLWSLAQGLEEFPEAPPPGLVTVPAGGPGAVPRGYHAMAGYRAAGERAIRIDMLERLADMLRGEDSRGGFEATPDMLSITGMTLEQFADLMEGLGYKAERAEREKVKPVDQAMAEAPAEQAVATDAATETAEDLANSIPDSGEAPVAADPPEQTERVADIPLDSETEISPGDAPDAPVAEPETEVFYTFTWAGRAARARQDTRGKPKSNGPKPSGKGARKGGKPGRGKPREDAGAKTFSARPDRKKDQIDPDNPFAAALMGLKGKG
jgi:ATP-dependent RNA helicase SUPV3L1/SUV3